MQEIKLHGIEDSMRGRWQTLQAKLFHLNMRTMTLNQWQQSGSSLLNEGKNLLITFLAAKAVIEGNMTLGAMLSVQYMIGSLSSPIDQLISFFQAGQNARISMERLNEIHDMPDEEPAGANLLQELPPAFARQILGGKHPPLPALPVAPAHVSPVFISITNMSFTYTGAGNEPVLKGISLDIPKGKTTAIVGMSGSGKTTLIKLLLKIYEPCEGTIDIHTTSLTSISHKAWRRNCGVVMQDSYIFSDSIGLNITLSEEPDHTRLQQALDVANIRGFVESLPLGLHTRIGPEGTGISMGQRQRILIARAVYRDPEFIFFDEATNSLDASNESVIMNNLEQFFAGRTVIVVAHRLSTVRNAHQIVVLNKGRIAEQGTHQQLIQHKGEYYSLVKNQLELDG
jgi:ATP-binding cassette subfamily B protein